MAKIGLGDDRTAALRSGYVNVDGSVREITKGYIGKGDGEKEQIWPPGGAIPDSGIYRSDDFGGGNFTSQRDGQEESTVTEEETNNEFTSVYRPDWTVRNGSPFVDDEILKLYSNGDNDTASIDSGWTVGSWRISFRAVDDSDTVRGSFTIMAEESSVESDQGNLEEGYYIKSAFFEGGRIDLQKNEGGDDPIIIQGSLDYNVGDWITVRADRDNDGNFDLYATHGKNAEIDESGDHLGSAQDTTFSNSNYMAVGKRANNTEVEFDDLRVGRTDSIGPLPDYG